MKPLSHSDFQLPFCCRCFFLSLMLWWGTGGSGPAMGIIMPIYGNISSQFSAAEAAARRVPLIAVFNPDDGPGTSKNSSYANSVNRIKAAGGEVVGYIATGYAGNTLPVMKSLMDKYHTWYGVQGYFLDEMTNVSNATNRTYYKSLYDYANGKNKFIVGNPGTGTHSVYLSYARLLITFENPISSGWGSAGASGDPARFGCIPYSSGSLGSTVTQAAGKGFGWIYVTNYGEPDPFGRLPSYWAQEVDAVESLNIPPLPAALPPERFFITSTATPAAGGVTVTFPAVARRRYDLQVSTNLQTWSAASTPDPVPVPAEITPVSDGLVTLRATPIPGARSVYYRAVDLDALAGK